MRLIVCFLCTWILSAATESPFQLVLHDAEPTNGGHALPERRAVAVTWFGSTTTASPEGQLHGAAIEHNAYGHKWGYNTATHTAVYAADRLVGSMRKDLWGSGGHRIVCEINWQEKGIDAWQGTYTGTLQPELKGSSSIVRQGKRPPFLKKPQSEPKPLSISGAVSLSWLPVLYQPVQPQTQGHPRLLFTDAEKLRAVAASADGNSIVKRLNVLLEGRIDSDSAASHAVGHATRYLLHRQVEDAEAARRLVAGYLEGSHAVSGTGGNRWTTTEKRILRSHIVAQVALAYDCLYQVWPAAFRQRVAGALLQRAGEMIDDQRRAEYNDTPSSNHWTLCNAAGVLALLAIQGDAGVDPQRHAELLRMGDYHLWKALVHPLAAGERGISGEGDAYSQYGHAHWWYVLRAYALVRGQDWLAAHPHLGDLTTWVQRLMPRKGAQPLIAAYGPYAWSGSLRPSHNPFVLGLCLQPDAERGHLGKAYRALFGPDGSDDWGLHQPHEALSLLVGYQPETGSLPARAPHRFDRKKGWYSFRSQSADTPDMLATVYAKHQAGGGWSFKETGGVRFIAGGVHWAKRSRGETKNRRGKGDWSLDTVVTVSGADGWLGGDTIHAEPTDHGGTIVMDLTQTLYRRERNKELLTKRRVGDGLEPRMPVYGWTHAGGSARRMGHIDDDHPGAEAVFVVADLFQQVPGEKNWFWHAGVAMQRRDDGFEMQAGNGWQAKGIFCMPQQPTFKLEGGQAQATGAEHWCFVLVVADGSETPAVSGHFLDVIVGKKTYAHLPWQLLFQR